MNKSFEVVIEQSLTIGRYIAQCEERGEPFTMLHDKQGLTDTDIVKEVAISIIKSYMEYQGKENFFNFMMSKLHWWEMKHCEHQDQLKLINQ